MTLFPFTAIVGQERLKKALLLNAVNPAVGGVLIQGESGTAKSTAVRGLATLMPEIDVTEGCPFGCDPAARCSRCTALASSGTPLATAARRRRVVDLPLNATEDRVAGTIDLAKALGEGVKALEPGLLALANRGVLYIDEINLLDDHLVDLLLDAAALGVNTVEREGISVSHPAEFLLVGTMNPEEGELRPQIADRLGLTVNVEPLEDDNARAEVMRRREQFTHNPDEFVRRYEDSERSLSQLVLAGSRAIDAVRVPDEQYATIGALVLQMGVRSHRADIALLECAKAMAALDERDATTSEDIAQAAALVLPHRMERDPFAPQPELEPDELTPVIERLADVRSAQKKTPATLP